MPDKDLALLMNLCVRNGGKLSKKKRKLFALLSDEHIAFAETTIQESFANYFGMTRVNQ